MDLTEYLPQKADSTRGAFRNIALPVLSILETIATAKASKGRYVGTTAADLMKRLEDQDEYKSTQRAKALDRMLAAQDREATGKRADRALDLQEKAGKRLDLQAKMGRDDWEREDHKYETGLNRRMAAIERMTVGTPNEFDESSNTLTMGRKPLPGLSPLDKEAIRQDPYKWTDKQIVQQREFAPPRPTAPKPEKPPKPLSGDAAKLSGITDAIVTGAGELKQLVKKYGARGIVARYKAGDPGVANVINDLADGKGRLRSGGAVNVDEEARFKAPFTGASNMVYDNDAEMIKHIDRVLREAEVVKGKMADPNFVWTAPPESPVDSSGSGWMDVGDGVRVRRKR